MPTYAQNRDANRQYAFEERLEAGVVLTGAEVKAIKSGNVSLKGAYATFRGDRLVLLNMHIGRYRPAGNLTTSDPTRTRALLVGRKDISRFIGKIRSQGLSLVPLSVYAKHGLIKLELGLGRGQKAHDKRAKIKKRDADRDIRRAMRNKG